MTSLAELGDQLTTLYLFKMFSSKLNVLAYALTAWLKAWQTFHIVFSVQNSHSDSKYLHTQTHVLFSCLHQPISLTCKFWRCSSVQLYTPHPPPPLYPHPPPPPSPPSEDHEVLSLHRNHIFPGRVQAHSEHDDPSVRKQRRSVCWILPSYLWFRLQCKRNTISFRGTTNNSIINDLCLINEPQLNTSEI